MWKKVMLVLMVCLLTSPAGWAYKKLACEIEDENTVSYVVADAASLSGTAHQILFVKRVDREGYEEYWIRERVTTEEDRFLYYSSIIIDDIEYKIRELKEPKYYHIRTGESITRSDDSISPHAYYSIPKEVLERIEDAKSEIVIIMNRLDKQNLRFRVRDKLKEDMQLIISLTYEDKDKYWKPN